MQHFLKVCLLSPTTLSLLVIGCAGSPSGGAAPAAAATSAAPTVCATFYDDAQLKGATLVSAAPQDDSAKVPAAFNDKMSSVAVTAGCTVTAYPDENYGGQPTVFTETSAAVPAAFNDQMSSYKCSCGAPAAEK